MTKLTKPRCIRRAAVKPCEEEQEARSQWLEQEGRRLIEEAARDWNIAAQAKDTETLWKLWCTLVETLLLARAQEEGLWQPAPDEEQHFRGRGAPAQLQKEQIVPPSGPSEVGPTEAVLRRLDNLRRRIAHLARLQQSAQRGLVEARHLWAKIKLASRESLSEEQRTPLLAQRTPPTDHEALEAYAAQIQGLISTQAARGHVLRIREWEERIRRAWKEKPSEVYKGVRETAPGRTVFLKRDDGTLTGNWAEMQALAQDAWTSQVYCKPGRRSVGTRQLPAHQPEPAAPAEVPFCVEAAAWDLDYRERRAGCCRTGPIGS